MPISWPWRRTQKRSGTVSISNPYLAQMLGWTGGDMPVVSERLAMNLSGVFRAVSLIAGSIATLPIRTYVTDPATKLRTEGGYFLSNPAPLIEGKPMWQPSSWVELCMVQMLLHGNMYLKHVYSNGGNLSGLLPIHPLSVAPRWDLDVKAPGGRLYDVTFYTGAAAQNLTANDITHVMGLSLDGLKGISPLTAARISLGGSLAGDKAAAKAFTDGATIGGLVVPDDDMTPDEIKTAKRDVDDAMAGPENSGKWVFLNRKLTFSPWQMTAADAQFLESREFQIEEIGRWFGIPPHLLGVTEKSTSWGQGITEQNRGFARYTLRKHTTPFQQALTMLIPPGKTAEFDYSEFVSASPEDESTMLLAELNGGGITPNEFRQYKNLPPVDGGDVLRTPAGAAPTPAPAADAPAAGAGLSGGAQ